VEAMGGRNVATNAGKGSLGRLAETFDLAVGFPMFAIE
jgi:hypothetical protein